MESVNSSKEKIGSFFKRLNEFLKYYNSIIETISIVAGLAILFYTGKTLALQQKTLDLQQTQDADRIRPSWTHQVFDDATKSFIRLLPDTEGVRIQQATGYFSSKFNTDSIIIDGPDFDINLSNFKQKIIQKKLKMKPYYSSKESDVNIRLIEPIGIEINYVINGTVKKCYGLFEIQYSLVFLKKSESSQNKHYVILKTLLFSRFHDNKKDLLQALETIEG